MCFHQYFIQKHFFHCPHFLSVCNNYTPKVSSLHSELLLGLELFHSYTEASKYLSTEVFCLKTSGNQSWPETELVHCSDQL